MPDYNIGISATITKESLAKEYEVQKAEVRCQMSDVRESRQAAEIEQASGLCSSLPASTTRCPIG